MCKYKNNYLCITIKITLLQAIWQYSLPLHPIGRRFEVCQWVQALLSRIDGSDRCIGITIPYSRCVFNQIEGMIRFATCNTIVHWFILNI